MDLTPEKKRAISKWIIGIAAACILIFLGVQNIGAVAGVISQGIGLIMPLLVGVMLAVVLNVPMRFFESHIWAATQKPVCGSCGDRYPSFWPLSSSLRLLSG